MRNSYTSNFIVVNSDDNMLKNDIETAKENFVGIDLGADFCYEHECGIKGIQLALGINSEKFGIEAFCPNSGFEIQNLNFQKYGKKYIGLYFNARNPFVKITKDHLQTPYDKFGKSAPIYCQWDESAFSIVLPKEYKWASDMLINAAKNGDICIGIGRSHVFKNGGLKILIKSRMPREAIDRINADAAEEARIQEAVRKTKIIQTLNRAGKSWYALAPHWIKGFHLGGKEVKSKFDVIFFLNPTEQDENNSGWFTVEELKQWTKGYGPIPKNPKKRIFDII